MSAPKIEDLRFSSSAIDDFFEPRAQMKVAGNRIRVAGVGDLAGFRIVAEDTLVRVSQQDFWRLGQDDSGFYIDRLVDDSQGPVKG